MEENKIVTEKKEETPVTKKPKKKRKVGRIITNIILTLIVLFILAEAAIGIVNMQKINKGEEPVWYLNTKVKEYKNKTVTEYDLGLYKIVKTDTDKESKTTLRPFFIKD